MWHVLLAIVTVLVVVNLGFVSFGFVVVDCEDGFDVDFVVVCDVVRSDGCCVVDCMSGCVVVCVGGCNIWLDGCSVVWLNR